MRRSPLARWMLIAFALTAAMACAHPRQMTLQGQGSSRAAPAPAPGRNGQVRIPGHVEPGPALGQVAPIPAPARAPLERVSFAGQVQPILEARCRPCHFAGGQMYERLPFDRPATILELREKLFTRIKKEEERRTIREFLAAHPRER